MSTIAQTAFDGDHGCLSASVLLYNRDENGKVRYLALERAERKSYPGTYSLPGGKVDPGETPAQAAARETFEEIGYWPEKVTPVTCFNLKKDKLYVIFMAEAHKRFDPRFGQDYKEEHAAFEWTKLKSWPKPMNPKVTKLFNDHKQYIKDVAKGRIEPETWIDTPQNASLTDLRNHQTFWRPIQPIADYIRHLFHS